MDNPFVEHAQLQLLQGSHVGALRAARMGLTLSPDDPDLLDIAANCAAVLGDDAYAVTCWQRLLGFRPAEWEPRNNLALALERLERNAEAEAVYRQGLAILPDEAILHSNLGLLLEKLGHLAEAESQQRQAFALAPAAAEINCNLAGALLKRGCYAEAESLYRAALQLKPELSNAHGNFGVLLTECGRLNEAEACFRRALALQPDSLQVTMNLAELLLMQGCLAEGWPLYERRQMLFVSNCTGPLLQPSCPQWQGEPLAGKAIMVLPEQGLGDEIQFARYLVWLKEQGPARLTLVCRPSQQALLETLAGPDQVISLSEAEPALAQHDYWVFLLSLPLHAGTTLATIPAAIPYLFPDPRRQARFAAGLAGDGWRVGLVWKGNPKHLNDAERSLPGLEVLAPLWSLAGIRFFSLQKSERELPRPSDLPLTDLSPMIGDFADTAAILSQLDLLICVDTSVAHLAGALGVPCWVLLPCHKTDWRWLLQRSDSPWYPSLRLFRQEKPGDWQAPAAALLQALREFRRAPGKD